MKIKPIFDKVVISLVANDEKTKSGIVLPTQAQEKQQLADVVAVGPGGIIDGKEIKMQVKIGDKVLFSKFAGNDFKLDGKDYIILRQSDILAIIE